MKIINKEDLIDRQALLRDIEKYHLSDGKFQHWVEVQPSIDAVEVVRCKDCIWRDGSICLNNDTMPWSDDDFCSNAEKRQDG